MPHPGTEARRVGCRVVTTSLTARVLLANQMRALDDVEWTVVSGDAFDDPPDGVTVEVIPIRREFALSDFTSFVRLWRYFRRHRFDFAQTHTPKASFLGLPAARLAGTPAIYTIHGALYFRDNGRLANVLGWCFERWCCSWADRVLVQSHEDEQVLPRVRICPERKLGYVGNGIVLSHFESPGGTGHHVGAPDRHDGQPTRPGKRLSGLPGPGRRAVRAGRLRPRRTVRTRPERRALRRGGRPRHRRRARSRSWAVSTTCARTWPRPTSWCFRPTARGSPGWSWRRRSWDAPWSPTTSVASARCSTRRWASWSPGVTWPPSPNWSVHSSVTRTGGPCSVPPASSGWSPASRRTWWSIG